MSLRTTTAEETFPPYPCSRPVVVFWAVLWAVWLGQEPGKFMGDNQPLTWFSFLQLLGTAGIVGRIFQIRRGQSPNRKSWKAPFFVWLLVSIGFIFLAFDEVVQIHEKIDYQIIHKRIFSMQETELTDRLDDVIVGGYGVVGVWILYWYRKELRHYRAVIPRLTLGLVLFFFMILFDMASNRNDLFPLFLSAPRVSIALYQWSQAVEDGLKILAEGCLLSVAYDCLVLVKTLHLHSVLEA